MLKILVIGYYFSRNLGDAVICDCVAERLRQAYPDASVSVADIWGRVNFPEKKSATIEAAQKRYRFLRRIGAVSKYTPFDLEGKRQERVLAGCREGMRRVTATDCDIVVFAGGQLFMDWFSVGLSYYIHKFSGRNIPILFNACGTGPEYSRNIRRLFSESLMNPHVKWISSRDQSEHITERYLRNGKTCVPVTDPALWADKVYGVHRNTAIDIQKNVPENGTIENKTDEHKAGTDKQAANDRTKNAKHGMKDGYVGLGMILPYNLSYRKLADFWKKMIYHLNENGIPWKVSLNGGDNDRLFAEKVLEEIGLSDQEVQNCILPIPEKPEELVANIAGLRGLISFRLHSHIIATSLNVPTVAVVWDKKVPAFFEKIGHPERCFTLKDSPETIWKAFEMAEQEGYDRALIDRERQDSERLLLENLNQALHISSFS